MTCWCFSNFPTAELLLRSSKVANNMQRKVQDYDLGGFTMITSAFSSSSCTLGPNVSFQFTIHCGKKSHSFATSDEETMLIWVAALKQVLAPPSLAEGNELNFGKPQRKRHF